MTKWMMSMLLLTAGAVAAADVAAPGKTYAVIVGVSEYTDPKIKADPTAQADAKAFADLILSPDAIGADKANVTLLMSKETPTQPTKEAILKALADVTAKATKADTVFVVLFGSGAPVGERASLLTNSSTYDGRAKDALLAEDIEKAIKDLKAGKVNVLIDIDQKGFKAEKDTPVAAGSFADMTRVFLGLKDKDDTSVPEGKLIYIANDNSPTLSIGANGLFTKVAIDALKGAADTEGDEADGNVTVEEFTKYCEKQLTEEARKIGKNNEEKAAVHYPISSRGNRAILAHNPAEWKKAAALIEKLEALGATQKLAPALVEEGKTYLGRMPRLKALREMRKEYRALVEGKTTVDAFTEARKKILEGMTITTTAAEAYASRVMSGLETVQTSYIKEQKLSDLVANAVRGLYLRADEKLPDELKTTLDGFGGSTRAELRKVLTDARVALGTREDLDKNKDVELTLQMVMSKLDRYSEFVEKDKVEQMDRDLGKGFSGIGVIIRREVVKDGLMVVTPIKDSPAYRAGIKAGDVIKDIIRKNDSEGKALDKEEVTSTRGMKTDEAVKLILGKPGTEVSVTVEREGSTQPVRFDLNRGRIAVETVLGYKREKNDDWNFYVDPESKIAYIYLTQFGFASADELEKVMKKLEKDGIRGMVFDLRYNPGGYLPVVVKMCDMFLEDGAIVEVRPRVGEKEAYRKRGAISYLKFPMVCMVNGYSASASEIMSACLQDHGRALVVGERSYGKGSVQTIMPFRPTGGELKMTIATFWRPSGINLNKSSTSGKDEDSWGVSPTEGYNLKLSQEESIQLADRLQNWINIPRKEPVSKEAKEFKDRQLDKAVEYLKSQIKLTSGK